LSGESRPRATCGVRAPESPGAPPAALGPPAPGHCGRVFSPHSAC